MIFKNAKLKYGLIAGGAMVLVFSVSLKLMKDPRFYSLAELLGYTTMLLSLLAIFFGIRHERERLGRIGFGRGFGVGLQIAVIAGIMFGIFTFALYKWLDPGLTDRYQQQYIEQIKNSGAPQERIDKELARMQSMGDLVHNSYFQAFVMFATVFALGLIIALFSALILRTRTPRGEATANPG